MADSPKQRTEDNMSEHTDTDSRREETGESSPQERLGFTHPETVQIDSPFEFAVDGIRADAVDIRLSLTDAERTEWTATESFDVTDGYLDIGHPPASGSHDESIPTLLQQAVPAEEGVRYSPPRGDGEEVTITVDSGDSTASTTIEREFGPDGVEAQQVDSEEFVGTVYYPPGEEPAPAVVALHGSGGEPARSTARLLASHGFVALAVHYFDWRGRHEMLPRQLVEVPIAFVGEATDWLLDDSRVDGSRVGIWGASKGGELGLLAGARLDTVGPVVSVNGSGVVWQGFSQGQTVDRSSWSASGESVPYVPYTTESSVWDETPPMTLEPAYSRSYEVASQDEIDRATIEVEAIEGPVLLVSGGDDSMWESTRLQEIAAQRLDDHGSAYEHLVYEDAGHAINYPYLPTENRGQAGQFVMGGDSTGYAVADREYWSKALATLDSQSSTVP